MKNLRRLRRDQKGGTAIEYSLIATLVSIAIVVGATLLGSKLEEVYLWVASSAGLS